MRLLPILAAATIGVFAVTAVNAQGTQQGAQQGTGNPSGAQNMDTATKGNPNTPSAGQTTGTSSKAMKKKSKKNKSHMESGSEIKAPPAGAGGVLTPV